MGYLERKKEKAAGMQSGMSLRGPRVTDTKPPRLGQMTYPALYPPLQLLFAAAGCSLMMTTVLQALQALNSLAARNYILLLLFSIFAC